MTIHERAADNIRALSVAMVEKAKSGHPGGAMGGADYIHMLYAEFLCFNPDNFSWPFRDRFFLDPGHMSPMLYSMLSFVGALNMEDLKNFRQWGSKTPGHPELNVKVGIENTSGPLGQGHTMAVGAAIAEKFLSERFGDWMSHRIYTFISDGGIQEEISQGAGRIAGHLGLNNLIMFYDANQIQLATRVDQVSTEDTARKYEAWGWRVMTIDGNDHDEIRAALMMAQQEAKRPVLIIGNTVMGKKLLDGEGHNYEFRVNTHGQPVSKAGASLEKTYLNLGAVPENPFVIFQDVKAFYQDVLKEKRAFAEKKEEEYSLWKTNNPELASKLQRILDGKLAEIDFSSIDFPNNSATRSSSSIALAEFAKQFDNMIVMSADLANSDKTEGFLKNSSAISRNHWEGAFLHAGVSELTMGALANGLALHNIIPVCGTFFVFSDYMKPAMRMAALMELPVKYIWTHDSFRVGEDGPTHQPVEQEMQVRLMEKLKNHSGNLSMIVLRPADTAETFQAWKMALENTQSPTALILSRQNINDLPAKSGNRFLEAVKIKYGAYTVIMHENPHAILIANGSEVSTLIDAAGILEKKNGWRLNVVSVISEGLFDLQDQNYKREVLPEEVPRFALTAGLPVTMQSLAGQNGKTFGLDHFGYSANYNILDDKFGFTAEKVALQIEQWMNIK